MFKINYEYNYLKQNYLIFFILKKRTEYELIKDFLRMNKFIVNNNFIKKEDKFIVGVNIRKKSIYELIYLIILVSYYCNLKDIREIEIKFNSIFRILLNLAKELEMIFYTILNYKVSYYKNNIKIDKNILKTNIDKKNEIIIDNLKIMLAGNYKEFFEFIDKLKNRSKNIFVKKILNDFLKKIDNKKQEQKNELEEIKSLLDI